MNTKNPPKPSQPQEKRGVASTNSSAEEVEAVWKVARQWQRECDAAEKEISSLKASLAESRANFEAVKEECGRWAVQCDEQEDEIDRLRTALEGIARYETFNGDGWPAKLAKAALSPGQSNESGTLNAPKDKRGVIGEPGDGKEGEGKNG